MNWRLSRVDWLLGIAACAVVFAAPAIAAPPVVPQSLPYQGLLLDGLGQPRTGSVDLTLRIYDAVVGGTLVYKQSFPSVSLVDGVFNVQLGPSGEGSDAPSNPLTTDLATALGGDAGATSPVRFLQVTVGSDGPLARTQILSSAYALRATSAATADTAINATNVSGVSGVYVNEFFEHFPVDGAGPANFDPREGIADTDGDGVLNFADSDNDGDGISDGNEVAQASDINLVTPTITGLDPVQADRTLATPVTVSGSSFQPGMTVSFGAATPTPVNLTPTSFEVTVGPHPGGPVSVSVVLPNGQSATAPDPFTFFSFASSITHAIPLPSSPVARAFGLAVRQGTTQVLLAGLKQYGAGDGTVALPSFPLASRGSSGQIAVAFDASGRTSGLRCRDLGSTCAVEILVDTDADQLLEDETGTVIQTLASTPGGPQLDSATLRLDPAGHWVAGYVRRGTAPAAAIANDRNGDGDFDDTNERVTLDTNLLSNGAAETALAIDSAGRVAYVYPMWTPAVRVAWDRNGDGDFSDTISSNPEISTLAPNFIGCLGATFDESDHLAVIYNAEGETTVLARDLNGDGDFVDANESTVLATGATGQSCDVAKRPGQPLAVAYSTAGGVQLLLDKNADGDFADSEESNFFVVSDTLGLVLELNGVNRAVMGSRNRLTIGATN